MKAQFTPYINQAYHVSVELSEENHTILLINSKETIKNRKALEWMKLHVVLNILWFYG